MRLGREAEGSSDRDGGSGCDFSGHQCILGNGQAGRAYAWLGYDAAVFGIFMREKVHISGEKCRDL